MLIFFLSKTRSYADTTGNGGKLSIVPALKIYNVGQATFSTNKFTDTCETVTR